jgi:hypothetical protein
MSKVMRSAMSDRNSGDIGTLGSKTGGDLGAFMADLRNNRGWKWTKCH